MLEEIQAERQKKLEAIRELGIDPYGWRYDGAEPVASIAGRYVEDREGQRGDVAGRLVLLRDMGKLIFAQVRDETGTLQIALRRNVLDEKQWSLAKLLDLGDLVAVRGDLMRTRTGELTVFADGLTLLCKSLLPLPEKFHGLQDTELRYRKRYLDLIVNPESMEVFRRRVAIIRHFRRYLEDRGFMEVETPMMQSIFGGAAAKPFLTHHNALDRDLYLRISPELFLKRLLVGGMEKVFEINRNFRNEGIDSTHNPEFTMMELYQARADYDVMMELTEGLIASAAQAVCGSMKLPYGGQELDYTPPWRRATYGELLAEHAGVSLDDPAGLRAKARRMGLEEANKADAVVANLIFEEAVEPTLVQPTFVRDYPADLCPLTRRDPGDSRIALRFEAYAATMELANAYTELNDPAVQEANFRMQLAGEAADETMRVMDNDFIAALQHGMPPAGGLGIGIDRVVMLLTGTTTIRDVVLFPTLRTAQS
ncbi:MAG: lysine--tRNA ligase [Planctomycetes bacterium]|nr:lysine--tRNA ligase [Planctomycetota bacterium]